LAAAGAAPSKAQAGCGDGVGSLHDVKVSHTYQPMPPSNSSRQPCDGPACQEGSVPLVPTVPPAPPPSAQEWSCLTALLTLPAATPVAGFARLDPDLPTRLPHDIFHPPRYSSL